MQARRSAAEERVASLESRISELEADTSQLENISNMAQMVNQLQVNPRVDGVPAVHENRGSGNKGGSGSVSAVAIDKFFLCFFLLEIPYQY